MRYEAAVKVTDSVGVTRTMPGPAAWIFVHELMHLAYGHPWRGLRASQRLGKPYHQKLLNWTADLVINEAIEQWAPTAALAPNDAIFVASLKDLLKTLACGTQGVEIPERLNKHPLESSAVQLHDALLVYAKACEEWRRAVSKANSQSTIEINDDISAEAGNDSSGNGHHLAPADVFVGEAAKRSIDQALREWSQATSDLREPPKDAQEHSGAEREMAEWRRELQAAGQLPGSFPGQNVVKAAALDPLPYPWRRLLQPLLSRFLAPRPGVSDLHPSRGMLACMAAEPSKPQAFEQALRHGARVGSLRCLWTLVGRYQT